jgi:hypothetical protein
MVREVYEETSLYLPMYKQYLTYNNNQQPIMVVDNPESKRQNVSLIYLSVYDMKNRPELFPEYIQSHSNNEASKVMWMNMSDFYTQYEVEYDWAFNHDETIKDAVRHFNKGI